VLVVASGALDPIMQSIFILWDRNILCWLPGSANNI